MRYGYCEYKGVEQRVKSCHHGIIYMQQKLQILSQTRKWQEMLRNMEFRQNKTSISKESLQYEDMSSLIKQEILILIKLLHAINSLYLCICSYLYILYSLLRVSSIMLSILTQIISIPFTIVFTLWAIISVIISTIFTILTFIVNIIISILSLLFTVIQIVFSIVLNTISFILPVIVIVFNFICYSIFGNILYGLKVLLEAVPQLFYWVSDMLLIGYYGPANFKESVGDTSAAIGNIENKQICLATFSFTEGITKNKTINGNQESDPEGSYLFVIIIVCCMIFIFVLAIILRTREQRKRIKRVYKTTNISSETSISTGVYLKNPVNQNAKEVRRIRQAYNNLTCSISLKLINEPGSLKCGHTFEKKQIILALSKSKRCPLCLKPSTPQDVFPNFAMKQVLSDFRVQLAQKGRHWALRVLGIQDYEQEVVGKRV